MRLHSIFLFISLLHFLPVHHSQNDWEIFLCLPAFAVWQGTFRHFSYSLPAFMGSYAHWLMPLKWPVTLFTKRQQSWRQKNPFANDEEANAHKTGKSFIWWNKWCMYYALLTRGSGGSSFVSNPARSVRSNHIFKWFKNNKNMHCIVIRTYFGFSFEQDDKMSA